MNFTTKDRVVKVQVAAEEALLVYDNIINITENYVIFKGMFKNGKPDGKGKISYKGKTIECEFQNGKPISDLSILYSSF